jgi:hypothetical protein
MTPRPQEECQEKARLRAELKEAMATVLDLSNRQIELVHAGQFEELEFLEARLVAERIRKNNLLSDYKNHMLRHGC